jgi:mono/diheme cytochrome c family protein
MAFRSLLLLPTLLALAAPAAAQQPATPDSATVAAGKKVFEGAGLCFSCHGMKGEGMLGPTTILNGNKEKWLHSDGSWEAIVKLVAGGIDAKTSTSGQLMPPRGGSAISDAQLRQVAAYVRTLHRTKPE